MSPHPDGGTKCELVFNRTHDQRALINYQDGVSGEWLNNCYADEVPLWLLISLFRRIQRRKPLGDQEADETITSVRDVDAAYVNRGAEAKQGTGPETGKLHVTRQPPYVRRGDDERR